LLSRSDQLFQTALDARELLARAEAAAPLGPLLQPLLVLARAGVLPSRACLVLVVQRPLFENGLLTRVVLLRSSSPRDDDRIHHQPMADARSRRTRHPSDQPLGGGGARELRIYVPRQRGKLFGGRDERRGGRDVKTLWPDECGQKAHVSLLALRVPRQRVCEIAEMRSHVRR